MKTTLPTRVETIWGRRRPGAPSSPQAQSITPAFRARFDAFKADAMREIGDMYLLVIPHQAVATVMRYANELKADVDLVLRSTIILANIRDNADISMLAVSVFTLKCIISDISRQLNQNETDFLELLTEELNRSGYSEIPDISELPGVTVYFGNDPEKSH